MQGLFFSQPLELTPKRYFPIALTVFGAVMPKYEQKPIAL